jgi:heme exporter protein D
MAAFFEMGGYGAYVWPAYGLAAVVLIGLLAASLRALRARETALKAFDGGPAAGDDGAGA